MAVATVSMHMERGEYWQRVIDVHDRRTHWRSPMTQTAATMQDAFGNQITIPATIQSDGAVLLVMDETATMAVPANDYYVEIWGDPYIPQYVAGGGLSNPVPRYRKIARGTLEVAGVDYTDYLVINSGVSPTISQAAGTLDLEWVEGDPVSLSFSAYPVDWSGSYNAQVRSGPSKASPLLGTLTVTAVYDTPSSTTNLTLTMSQANSILIPSGNYFWDLQVVNGVTRLSGKVTVDSQVTAP